MRGTKSRNSGRYYFEVTLTALGVYFLDCVGVVNSSFTDWTVPIGNDSSGNSAGPRQGSPPRYICVYHGTVQGGLDIPATPAAGDVIGIACGLGE